MILRHLPLGSTLAFGGAALLLLAAAAPPAGSPQRPTAAQIARIKALVEKVGACHRSHAIGLAAGEAKADAIVTETLSACESGVVSLQTQLSKYIGASAAERAISVRRPIWREAIRRIVAAERARMHAL